MSQRHIEEKFMLAADGVELERMGKENAYKKAGISSRPIVRSQICGGAQRECPG